LIRGAGDDGTTGTCAYCGAQGVLLNLFAANTGVTHAPPSAKDVLTPTAFRALEQQIGFGVDNASLLLWMLAEASNPSARGGIATGDKAQGASSSKSSQCKQIPSLAQPLQQILPQR
jgi:hypothetical protein